jgi:hypothetical protein
MSWCSRCGEYDTYGSCRCTLRGRAWFVENGEESAKDVWSVFDDKRPELFLDKWAARIDANSAMETFTDWEERAVAFQSATPGAPVVFLRMWREMEPAYYAESADKDDETIAFARHCRAKDLVRDRKERREWRAKQAKAMP